jgi:hypothetical protein
MTRIRAGFRQERHEICLTEIGKKYAFANDFGVEALSELRQETILSGYTGGSKTGI